MKKSLTLLTLIAAIVVGATLVGWLIAESIIVLWDVLTPDVFPPRESP